MGRRTEPNRRRGSVSPQTWGNARKAIVLEKNSRCHARSSTNACRWAGKQAPSQPNSLINPQCNDLRNHESENAKPIRPVRVRGGCDLKQKVRPAKATGRTNRRDN